LGEKGGDDICGGLMLFDELFEIGESKVDGDKG
jgi:hypothetical protein